MGGRSTALRSPGSSSPLRVLVLTQHYWPEIAATAQLLADVCEDLVDSGHQVTVLCGQPSYRTGPGALDLARAEIHRGVRIQRVWSHIPQRRNIPGRLANYASYFASSLAGALRQAKPDVCLVISTPPLLLGLSGSVLRALRGVPFVYSVQDLYPDVAVHLGVLEANGIAERVVEAVAGACYRTASSLVTLSDGMAGRLVKKGVASERIQVVPNWADTAQIKPTPRDNSFAREHGLADRFVAMYAGNLGQSQGLEHIVAAASLVRDLPITFAFVGDGNARARLEQQVEEQRLPNVRFFPPQPRERLCDLLGACDVGLVTMKRSLGDDLVPSKLYGIMAAARPVFASVEQDSEVARTLSESGCGWIVAPESAEAVADGLRAVSSAPESERRRVGGCGRAAAEAKYSRRVNTARYERLLSVAAGRCAFTLTTETAQAGVSAER